MGLVVDTRYVPKGCNEPLETLALVVTGGAGMVTGVTVVSG